MNKSIFFLLLVNIFCSVTSYAMEKELFSKRPPPSSKEYRPRKKPKIAEQIGMAESLKSAFNKAKKNVNIKIANQKFRRDGIINPLINLLDTHTTLDNMEHYYTLLQIAELYRSIQNDESLHYYAEAMEFAKAKNMDNVWYFDALMGYISVAKKTHEDLSSLLNEAQRLLENNQQRFQFFTEKAQYHLRWGRIEQSKIYLEEAQYIKTYLENMTQYRVGEVMHLNIEFLITKAYYLIDKKEVVETKNTVAELALLLDIRKFRITELPFYFSATELCIDVGDITNANYFFKKIHAHNQKQMRYRQHEQHKFFFDAHDVLQNNLKDQYVSRRLWLSAPRRANISTEIPDGGIPLLTLESLKILYPATANYGVFQRTSSEDI